MIVVAVVAIYSPPFSSLIAPKLTSEPSQSNVPITITSFTTVNILLEPSLVFNVPASILKVLRPVLACPAPMCSFKVTVVPDASIVTSSPVAGTPSGFQLVGVLQLSSGPPPSHDTDPVSYTHLTLTTTPYV